MCVGAFVLPIDFELTGEEVHDVKIAPGFIDKLPPGDYLIADKGYDSEELRQKLLRENLFWLIPRKSNSTIGSAGIATRFDKFKRDYEGMLALAWRFLWLPM